MYLVHWPIVALYRYETGLEPTAAAQALLALATVAGTVLLHYGVERRFYRRDTAVAGPAGNATGTDTASTAQASGLPLYRRPVATILASLMLVALLPLSAWLGDGWSWREPDVVLAAEAVEAGKQRRYTHIRAACPINELDTHPACDRQKPLQVLVIGNSHEPDGFNFIHAGYGGDEVNLIRFGTTNTCPDLAPEGVAVTDDCKGRMAALLSADVMASLDVVVYAANKPFHANKAPFINILSKLKARNPALPVITIGGYINTRTDCWRLTNAARTTAACRDPANVTYFAVTPETQPLYRDLMALTDHFVDRIDLLCRDRQLQTCAIQAEDGTPAFLDRHHLSLEFASMAGRLYAARYPDLLKSR